MWLTIFMFFLHFIADFPLQSREMGKKKSKEWRWLFLHTMIQLVVMFTGLLLFLSPAKAYQIACLNAVIHAFIDWNIWKLYALRVQSKLNNHYQDDEDAKAHAAQNWEYWNDHDFYTTIGFDQFLHASTIVLVIWMVL